MTTAKKNLDILKEREPQLWREPLTESNLTERFFLRFACTGDFLDEDEARFPTPEELEQDDSHGC